MKALHMLFCGLFLPLMSFAQTDLFIKGDESSPGSIIFVGTDETLYVSGDYIDSVDVNDAKDSRLLLAGFLYLEGNIVLQAGSESTVIPPYTPSVDPSNKDQNDYLDTLNFQGIVFMGSGDQEIGALEDGATSAKDRTVHIPSFEVRKSGGTLIMKSHVSVFDSVRMTTGDLDLEDRQLRLMTSTYANSVIAGENTNSRIYGNGGEVYVEERSYVSSSNQGNSVEPAGIGLHLSDDGSGFSAVLRRVHNAISSVADSSINRYYEVIPASYQSAFEVKNVSFEYFDDNPYNELNGLSLGSLGLYLANDVTSGDTVWLPYDPASKPSPLALEADEALTIKGRSLITLGERNCKSNDHLPRFDIFTDIDSENSPYDSATFTAKSNALNICEFSELTMMASESSFPYYRWSFTGSLESSTYHIDEVLDESHEGTYRLLVRNNRGCEDTKSLQLNVRANPIPAFTMTPNNLFGVKVCTPQEISFVVDSVQGDDSDIVNYHWTFDDGSFESTTTDLTSHFYGSENLYLPELSVTSEYLCTTFDNDVDVDTLTVLDPPSILSMEFNDLESALITEACELETVLAKASTEYKDTTPMQSGGGTNNTDLSALLVYEWDFDNGLVVRDSALSAFSDMTHAFVHRQANKFYVKATVWDSDSSYSCISTDSTLIAIHPKPEPIFMPKFRSDSSLVNGEICEGVYLWMDNQSVIAASDTLPSAIDGYAWDFGNDSTSIQVDPLLNYIEEKDSYAIELIAYSDKQCSDTLTYSLLVNPAPDGVVGAEVYPVEDSVCLGETISFANGTTIPWGTVSYEWDFGDSRASTDEEPTHLYEGSGRYPVSLTRTSDKGCVNVLENINVVVNANPIALYQTIAVCDGQPMKFYNTSYESGPESDIVYSWDFGDGSSSSEKSPEHVYSIASFEGKSDSSFMVTLRITTNASTSACFDDYGQLVTVNKKPIFDLGQAVLSFGDTLLTPSDVSDAFLPVGTSYQWRNSTGQVLSTAESYNVTTSGSYLVDLTTTEGCGSTIDFPVYILESANLGGNQTFCISGVIDATPAGSQLLEPTSYRWYRKEGLNEVNLLSESSELSINEAGFYGVEVTYEVLGVSATTVDEIEVQMVDTSSGDPACDPVLYPEVDLGGTIVTCESSVILDAENPGSTYLWSDGSTNRRLEVFQSGTYRVEVTLSNENVASQSVDVLFLASEKPDLGDQIEVCGGVLVDAGVDAVSYLWSTGGEEETLYVEESGTYSLEVISSDLCINRDTLEVTVHPYPELDLGEDIAVCDGEVVAIGTAEEGTYLWSTEETTSEIRPADAGTYSLTLTSTDGCAAEDSVGITFYSLPEIDLEDEYLACDEFLLDAGGNGVGWEWSTGAQTQRIEILESGYFWVQATSLESCLNSDTTYVEISESPIVDLGDSISACIGDIVILDAGVNNSSYSLSWNTGAESQRIEVSATGTYSVDVSTPEGCVTSGEIYVNFHEPLQLDLGEDRSFCDSEVLDAGAGGVEYLWESSLGDRWSTQVIVPTKAGTYWLTVIDQNGCTASDSVTLRTTNQVLEASFLLPSEVVQGDYVNFVALTDPEPESYFWDFGNGVTSTIQNPLYQYAKSGEFTVTLTVSNGICTSSLSKQITVNPPGGRVIVSESGEYRFVDIVNTQVYPNPIRNEMLSLAIVLTHESLVRVSVFDLRGFEVFNHHYELLSESELKFDLNGLKEGIYIVRVQVGRQSKYTKFVKIK